MSASRLALGTVQFGLDYGINNKNGKVRYSEVLKILSSAKKSGIDTLDTAAAYGDAETVIGNAIRDTGTFNIVSKTSAVISVSESLERTLANLQADSLYGYLYHDVRQYYDNKNGYNDLKKLQESGKINKIGFSLYHTSDLETLLQDQVKFDLVQVPYNIFDTRFANHFSALKDLGVEIHTRSAFLQGLFFRNPNDLSDHFKSVKEILERLHKLSSNENLSVSALCLCFCLLNDAICKVVIGVDSDDNFRENIHSLDDVEKVRSLLPVLREFTVSDEKIILPFNWPK